MATILKLPDSTIQMIAAGEVITSPLNVIKELLENSLDAKATNIRVIINLSPPYTIEIIDNGTGIRKQDAYLLCKRHTTSKLTSADDLTRISSFGFRGEALASVSEMAEVQVESFNKLADIMGWCGKYDKGSLVDGPTDKYVENVGTQIKVSNLFMYDALRRKALSSSNFENRKAILELIKRYAIHHRDKITMSLKEVTPNKCLEHVCLLAPTSFKCCMGMFFGIEMEKNVIEVQINHEKDFKAEADIMISYKKSTAHSNQQSCIFILFVNNRLVDCSSLKKDVEAVVNEYLNPKQHISLIYIALQVPPCDIDVNMHPAKSTVALHYHVEIISLIAKSLRNKLNDSLATQVLTANSISNQLPLSFSQLSQKSTINKDEDPGDKTKKKNTTTPKRPHDLIHNDYSQRSLKQFITADQLITTYSPKRIMTSTCSTSTENIIDPRSESPFNVPPQRCRRDMRLKSICDLKQLVAKEMADEDSIQIIKNSVFVGIFDYNRALIQNGTKLYAINLKAYLREQYYQFYLFDFGNFPKIEILPPGNKIQHLVQIYLDDLKKHENQNFDKLTFKTAQSVVEKLLQHSIMFDDYLGLRFTETEILSIPCIMPDEIPNLVHLGKFLTQLANRVDYLDETECFRRIGRLVADFYSTPPANLKDINIHRSYHEIVKTKLYDAVKQYLIIPEWLFTMENICQISDTKDLYKVFERC